MKPNKEQQKDNFVTFLFLLFGVLLIATVLVDYYVSGFKDELSDQIEIHNNMVTKYQEMKKLRSQNPYSDKATIKTGNVSDIVKSYFSPSLDPVKLTIKPVNTQFSNVWEEAPLNLVFDDTKNPIQKNDLFEFLKQLYINSPFVKVKKLDLYFKEDQIIKFNLDLSQFTRIKN